MTTVDAALLAQAQPRGRSIAWWGVVCLIMTEGTIFAGLLAANFFLRASARTWPPPGVELPELPTTIAFSIVLWASSVPVMVAERAVRRQSLATARVALSLTFMMGAAFLAHTYHDFQSLHFGWRDHAYGSVFYTTVGLHATHLLVGLAMNAVVQAKMAAGRVTADRHEALVVFSLYWHFVDVVWVAVFACLIVGPHIR